MCEVLYRQGTCLASSILLYMYLRETTLSYKEGEREGGREGERGGKEGGREEGRREGGKEGERTGKGLPSYLTYLFPSSLVSP